MGNRVATLPAARARRGSELVEPQEESDPMSRNMLNGAQVIVDYLIQEKVPQVFGLCGHGNIQFIDALYERSDDIKTISVHHESVAGFMADVYYRVSGRSEEHTSELQSHVNLVC